MLRALRRLRGTPLDPFGRSHERRTERTLIVEYEQLVSDLCQRLTPDNASTLTEIAGLVDMVRGYDEIKLANVERYRRSLAERIGE